MSGPIGSWLNHFQIFPWYLAVVAFSTIQHQWGSFFTIVLSHCQPLSSSSLKEKIFQLFLFVQFFCSTVIQILSARFCPKIFSCFPFIAFMGEAFLVMSADLSFDRPNILASQAWTGLGIRFEAWALVEYYKFLGFVNPFGAFAHMSCWIILISIFIFWAYLSCQKNCRADAKFRHKWFER